MADTENMTALHFAIEGGHIEIVESLIENGADMNAENKVKTPSSPFFVAQLSLKSFYRTRLHHFTSEPSMGITIVWHYSSTKALTPLLKIM